MGVGEVGRRGDAAVQAAGHHLKLEVHAVRARGGGRRGVTVDRTREGDDLMCYSEYNLPMTTTRTTRRLDDDVARRRRRRRRRRRIFRRRRRSPRVVQVRVRDPPQPRGEQRDPARVRGEHDRLPLVRYGPFDVGKTHHVAKRVRRHRPRDAPRAQQRERGEPPEDDGVRELRDDAHHRDEDTEARARLAEVVQMREPEEHRARPRRAHRREDPRRRRRPAAAQDQQRRHARSERELLRHRGDDVVPQFQHRVDSERVGEGGDELPVQRQVRQRPQEERGGEVHHARDAEHRVHDGVDGVRVRAPQPQDVESPGEVRRAAPSRVLVPDADVRGHPTHRERHREAQESSFDRVRGIARMRRRRPNVQAPDERDRDEETLRDAVRAVRLQRVDDGSHPHRGETTAARGMPTARCRVVTLK
eukprot:31314-Pelagococcus_subviridis.AAC.4